ncbi:MAG: hypothetical protein ACXV4B_08585 [Halobacteriota archaeon]
MKGIDVRWQFIVLRAQGKSLTSCAHVLEVSRQTLANWERDHEEEIQNLRAFELDSLGEAFFMKTQGRIKVIGDALLRVKEELEKRDLSKVKTEKLFELQFKLVNELRKEPSTIAILSEEQIEQAIELRDRMQNPYSVYNPNPKRRPISLLEEGDEINEGQDVDAN